MQVTETTVKKERKILLHYKWYFFLSISSPAVKSTQRGDILQQWKRWASLCILSPSLYPHNKKNTKGQGKTGSGHINTLRTPRRERRAHFDWNRLHPSIKENANNKAASTQIIQTIIMTKQKVYTCFTVLLLHLILTSPLAETREGGGGQGSVHICVFLR